MRIYAKIKGKDYYNYNLIYISNTGRPHADDSSIMFDSNMVNLFDMDNYYSNYQPKDGCSVFVAPKCDLLHDDIRKNYVIKKNIDTGDCNVMDKLRLSAKHYYYPDYIFVNDTAQTIVAIKKETLNVPSDAYYLSKAVTAVPGSTPNMFIQVPLFTLHEVSVPEPYLKLLRGEVKKPVIPSSRLNIVNQNELTIDALSIVTHVAKNYYSSEGSKNFILAMQALNQTNWREYPYTMHMLYNLLTNNAYLRKFVHTPSLQPKSIQVMVQSMKRDGYMKDVSEKDYYLARDWFSSMLDISDVRFTTIKDLNTHLSNFGVGEYMFNTMFSNIVKIKKKSYEEARDSFYTY